MPLLVIRQEKDFCKISLVKRDYQTVMPHRWWSIRTTSIVYYIYNCNFIWTFLVMNFTVFCLTYWNKSIFLFIAPSILKENKILYFFICIKIIFLISSLCLAYIPYIPYIPYLLHVREDSKKVVILCNLKQYLLVKRSIHSALC